MFGMALYILRYLTSGERWHDYFLVITINHETCNLFSAHGVYRPAGKLTSLMLA